MKKSKPKQSDDAQKEGKSEPEKKLEPEKQNVEEDLPDLKDPEVQKATSLIQVFGVSELSFWYKTLILSRPRACPRVFLSTDR